MEEETKGIFRKAVDAVNPGWLSFCGGIGLLSFMIAVSFRIMDFNPGPLWELHYKTIIEEGRGKNSCDTDFKYDFEKIKSDLEKVKKLAHEKGR